MDRLEEINISTEMEKSFLEYSMSVIVARAIPDLRDGLKPVHRRILYTMLDSGFTPDKGFVKSAKTVGAVIGNFHPHGDAAVYDAMVRMAQDFSYRYQLIDGHGNFGSVDGSTAAAYRYTESKISKISMELLRDINKNTVDFMPNFDSTRQEPVVLPSRFPNILVNGTMGIAVGMATNIPPHNLGEVIDGCVAYIDNSAITLSELMQHVKGPDFPTGGSILGNSGIIKAYETGKGSITIRGKVDVVENKDRYELVITEVPYQVNTTSLIQRIGELVRDKVIEGISDLREETSLQNGMKIVIELKRDANPNVVLNNLYKHSQLQTTYGINNLMLHQGRPQTFGLKDIISNYIDFQKEVIYRRTKFELDKALARAHILEGLKIALDNIDEVVKIIKESASDTEAKESLIKKFGLDEIQAESILEMKLRKLTSLEKNKILNDLKELELLIEKLRDILSSDEKVLAVVKEELLEIKAKYADERKTKIDMTAIEFIEDESLIPVENVIISLTNKGYVKRVTADTYKQQNKGGVGVKGMTTNEEDFVEHLVNLTTHDYVLFFTNKGRVYRIKGYEIPEFSRQSKGLPIINILSLDKDENVKSILPITNADTCKFLLFATKNGIVKRTSIDEFENIRTNGKIAISLKENDELIAVKKTNGANEIILAGSNGRLVRFNEEEIRIMGRTASGVRGINLEEGICVGADIAESNTELLIITEKGYGKRTPIDEYRITHRGSKGVKTINITDKNGPIVTFKTLYNIDKDLILTTNSGILIRISLQQVSKMSRVTQGVRLINLKNNQVVTSITLVESENSNETDLSKEAATKNEQ